MVNSMKVIVSALLFFLVACVTKPPVQEMAEARSAVKMAQELSGSHVQSTHYLQSAEKALQSASEAIEKRKYDRARNKALEAKRQAQKAVRIAQQEQ